MRERVGNWQEIFYYLMIKIVIITIIIINALESASVSQELC